jgi:hypothetical protein
MVKCLIARRLDFFANVYARLPSQPKKLIHEFRGVSLAIAINETSAMYTNL